MGYQSNKKRRYRVKPLSVLMFIVIIAIVICFIVFLATGGVDEEKIVNNSSELSSTISEQTSSKVDSSDLSSDTVSENKSVGGEIDSSNQISSNKVSSQSPSSNTQSSNTQSSNTQSSNTQSSNTQSSNTQSSASSNSGGVKIINAKEAVNDLMWNLILVNSTHQLDGDMDIQKTKFDTQYVDSRAASAYQAMYDAAKNEGITLYLRSGYRSYSTQMTNYNADIQRNIKNGNSKEEAIRLTEQYYARPGQSEHHTGLAFDIITPEYHKNIYTLNEKFAQTEAYEWLIKNCAEYGFILRFPKDKVDKTMINYEPWHYRYVGVEHAKEIMNKNLCLEEYLAE